MTIINDREYKIIIPKFDNSGRKIKAEEIEKIAVEMSKHFGGTTIIPSVLGCWVDRVGELICEENIVISSLRDSESSVDWEAQKQKDENFIVNMANRIGIELGQDSILVSEDKVEVDFVRGRYKKELPEKKVGIDFFRKLI